MNHPDIRFEPSVFGGGWVFALTAAGHDVMETWMEEIAYPLPPFGGEEGWMIEPWQIEDLDGIIQSKGLRT